MDAKANINSYRFDLGVFTHILVHILTNAVNYGRIRSTVGIECSVYDEHNANTFVQIVVRDQGSGISQDTLDQLITSPRGLQVELSSLVSPQPLNLKHCKLLCQINGGDLNV